MIKIRKFQLGDEEKVSEVIKDALLKTNINDYKMEDLEKMVKTHQPKHVKKIAELGSSYVAIIDNKIVGCGTIKRHPKDKSASYITTVFIDSKYQNIGVGRKIIEALEEDNFFKKSKRCEVSSSLTAEKFYKKLGYKYLNGKREIHNYGGILMEKFNEN